MLSDSSNEKLIEFTDKAVNGVLNFFESHLDDGPGFISDTLYENNYFYSGNEAFIKNPAKKASWRLGYACVDLTPYDFLSHRYYLGGYMAIENGFSNRVEALIDEMQCRIIALDDMSGRGLSFFATVDCIGMTNTYIKLIRRRFADRMKYEFPKEKIVSVNIFSTHTHSCIDTQGLWTDTGHKLLKNIRKNKTGKGTYADGADCEYMQSLTDSVVNGLVAACRSMCQGELSYAKKGIGSEYFDNKNRRSATSLITDFTRLVFTPADDSVKPTLIASFGAHPDVAGLPTSDKQGTGRELSGDYIYYMGEFINRAGYNFMFFNGAICAIYMARGATNDGVNFSHRYEQSARYGKELAKIALSLTKTVAEIEADELLFDKDNTLADIKISECNGANYTLWYENWEPVKEIKLKPILNIAIQTVNIPVTNPLIKLVGKLNLARYGVIRSSDDTYSIFTEIGYMEIGGILKYVLVPGEFCSDLLVGGASLTSEGSYSKTPFGLPCLSELFGENIMALGLANDAIGYIVPDNDFTMGDFKNHYHELICLGKNTASSIINGFIAINNKLGLKVK